MNLNEFMNQGRNERIEALSSIVTCKPTPRMLCADGFSVSNQPPTDQGNCHEQTQ